MKKNLYFIALALLCVFVVSSSQTNAQTSKTEKALFETETKIWQTLKDKKFDSIPQYFAKDYLGIYGYGIVSLDVEAQDIKSVDLKAFALSDVKFIHASKDVVIIAYNAKIEGTFKGQEITGNYVISSTWTNRGKWLTVAHTEAKAIEGTP